MGAAETSSARTRLAQAAVSLSRTLPGAPGAWAGGAEPPRAGAQPRACNRSSQSSFSAHVGETVPAQHEQWAATGADTQSQLKNTTGPGPSSS